MFGHYISLGTYNLSYQCFSTPSIGHTTGLLHVLFSLPRISLLPLVLPPAPHQSSQLQPIFYGLASLSNLHPPGLVDIYTTTSLRPSVLHTCMYLGTYLHYSCVSVSVFPTIRCLVCTMSSSSLYSMTQNVAWDAECQDLTHVN